MRNFVSISLLLSLSLASQGSALEVDSLPIVGSLPIFGSHPTRFGRADQPLIDASDVKAALNVLGRANYNLDDHVLRRSDSWSWKENGNACSCRPVGVTDLTHSPAPATKPGSADKPGSSPNPGSATKPVYKPHHKPGSTVVETPPVSVTIIPGIPGDDSDSFYHHHKPGSHKGTPHGDKPHSDKLNFTSLPSDGDDAHKPQPAPSTAPSTSILTTPVPSFSSPSTSISSPAPSSPSSSTPEAWAKTCPSGYKYASKEDSLIYSDSPLVDASNMDISIDILSFLHPSSPGKQTSTPAKGSPKCQSECCCYRTTPTPKTSCPSGYTLYSQGDSIVENDSALIDMSHLSISLDILNFGGHKSSPTSTSASAENKPTCNEKTCCVKQTTKQGSSIISNHKSLINESGIKVKMCILTMCA